MSATEPELHTVTLTICELCIGGAGGECHVPGCAFWMRSAPDVPLAVASREAPESEEAR